MLSIVVNQKEIFIHEGTSIQFELNNSIFSTDGIEGDVAYSFEIPAAPNDLILESARFVYVERRKRYECSVMLAGMPICNGWLYVTKSTPDSYNCEIAVNAFNNGWRDRKMKDNDYGEDIVISDSYQNHAVGWLAFLESTLDDNSPIKFPLFLDDEYYEDNEDFGMWIGKPNMPIGLSYNFSEKTSFVNRIAYQLINGEKHIQPELLFENPNGTIQPLDGRFGIFNREIQIGTKIEKKQLSLSPAFALSFLLHKVFSNSGYALKGGFVDSDELNTLFYQSLVSMDSTMRAYVTNDGFVQCSLYEDISLLATQTPRALQLRLNGNDQDDYSLFDVQSHSYRITQDGTYNFDISIKFRADVSIFPPNSAIILILKKYDSTSIPSQINFVLNDQNEYVPENIFGFTGTIQIIPFYIPNLEKTGTKFEKFIKLKGMSIAQYTSSSTPIATFDCKTTIQRVFMQNEIGNEYTLTFAIGQYYEDLDNGTLMMNGLTKPYCEAVVQIYSEQINNLNIYKKELRFNEYMPSLSNADFVKTLKNMYGLAIYVDSLTKEIELEFAKDIINSNAIDLSSFLSDESTAIEISDKKNITYTLDVFSPADIVNDINEADTISQLPDPRTNCGKKYYVRSTNEIYLAKREEDAEHIWRYQWSRFGDNNASLVINSESDNDETIKPSLKIPSMDYIKSYPPDFCYEIIDEYSSVQRPINDNDKIIDEKIKFPVIKGKCISYINENENSEEQIPLILLRKINDESLPIHTNYNEFQQVYLRRNWAYPTLIQTFSSVCYDNNDQRVAGNDLTATGDNSIGEIFVKPWLNFITNYDKVTYRFVFSPAKLLEVINIFKPQKAIAKDQVRMIYVNNVKVMPIRMTFEIVEGKSEILAEIECAKPSVELD